MKRRCLIGKTVSSDAIRHRRRRLHSWPGWGLALAGTLALVGVATLPPFVGASWRFVLMEAFSLVCHQLPARSPHVDGVALAVCHRCYGVYGGLAAGALLFPLMLRWEARLGRQAGPVLLLALGPAALDWGGGVMGLWANTPASRTLTGALFGMAAGFYLARAMARLSDPEAAQAPAREEAPAHRHASSAPHAAP